MIGERDLSEVELVPFTGELLHKLGRELDATLLGELLAEGEELG